MNIKNKKSKHYNATENTKNKTYYRKEYHNYINYYKNLKRQFTTKDCLKKLVIQFNAHILLTNSLCSVLGVVTDANNDQGLAS